MKQLLILVGVIFAVLFIVLVAFRGAADYLDAKSYADAAAVAIISDWNEQALLDRASPDLIQVTTREQMDSVFAQLRGLGRMTKYAGSSVETITFRFPWTLTTTVYVAKADFEHGSAQIKIRLISEMALGAFSHFPFMETKRAQRDCACPFTSLFVPASHRTLRPRAGARCNARTSLPAQIGLTPATIPWTNRGVRC